MTVSIKPLKACTPTLSEMKNLIHLLLFYILLFSNCSSSKGLDSSSISGQYIFEGYYDTGSSLILQIDHNFSYTWTQGLAKGESKGKWRVENNQVIFHSTDQETDQNYQIEIPPQTNRQEIEIKLIDINRNSLTGAECYLMKKAKIIETQISNDLGICQFIETDADRIKIRYLGYWEAIIDLKNQAPKSLIIKLKEGPTNYVYFKNRKFQIKGKRLKDLTNNSILVKTR